MFLFAVEFHNLKATKVFYVLSDNSINVTCPSQPCHTLGKYLLINNGTLPNKTNIEYHFLPGEHHIPSDIVLTNLNNFSIIGDVSEPSSPAVLIGCDQLYVLKITASRNVSIRTIKFERCYNPQLRMQLTTYFTSLYISQCFSCIVENVTFKNFGIIGENLIGQSYLNDIHVIHITGLFCQGITLAFWDYGQFTGNEHYLLMNKLNITVTGNGSKCYSFNEYYTAGVMIYVSGYAEKARITVNNSVFYNLKRTAMYIRNNCGTSKIIISLDNCKFEFITATNGVVVRVELSKHNYFLSFNSCIFKHNVADDSVISIRIQKAIDVACRLDFTDPDLVTPSNISFTENELILNDGKLLSVINLSKISCTLYMTGPMKIAHNVADAHRQLDLIFIQNMIVSIGGPSILSYNTAKCCNILKFVSSLVIFTGTILFKFNTCSQVIFLNIQQPYIKVLEYSNITFINNRCIKKLLEVEVSDSWNNYCPFQYITSSYKSVITPNSYAINIIRTSPTKQKECSFLYYHLNPKCEWLPNVTFQYYDSEKANHQIIQIDQQRLNYHRICLCYDNGSHSCSRSTLGPIYPGQVLQIGLCTPCDDNTFSLYAETHKSLQTNFSCTITNRAEILNNINSHVKVINYTIASEVHEMCKLFLTMYSHKQLYAYEVFYVKLLSCPVGFTLQNGVCDCDHILTKYIDKCYIDDSAIRRPANTWITAHTQANKTNYMISDCPMDYCLPHSFKFNLLYPNQQCQFERTGILCSQCQHSLSMVFGSSRCLKCTNLYILITIIIIVAGLILVVLLYILNLSVTKGTINGIILYANIISINDSIFLINNNIFAPLKVFISFANLDLGIETCFYDGMESYAKMWLQLFFPFYLTVIAVIIIITSRYSNRIFKLTCSRSLPVLATLFLLSYNGVLRTVLTVLFSYSTITHIPSGYQQIVWSIDASVPLFGVKFTILFVVCLLLFLLLIFFNFTLLFSRYLSRFRIINQFTPLLDAYHGSYKDKHYNWVAVNIILRSFFFALYGFTSKVRLLIATTILIIFLSFYGYIRPNRNKLVNIQELLLLLNLTILYAVSYFGSGYVFSLVTNIMISLAVVQFLTIILYHFLIYTCKYDVVTALHTAKENAMRCFDNRPLEDNYLNVYIALVDTDEHNDNYNDED